MGSIIDNFDTDTNFWEVNPELKIPKLFNDLYTSDKSKNKNKSSKLMWAVALLVDSDSKFRNLSEKEKKKLIAEDYLQEPDFNWEEYADTISIFENLTTSKLRKSLNVQERLLESRNEFLSKEKYTLDNAQELDKIFQGTSKIYETITKLRDEVQKEELAESGQGVVKGGRTESASEKGEL